MRIEAHGYLYEVLTESSLSRVIQHCKNGFISISASRSDNKDEDGNYLSPEENEKVNKINTKRLENDIRRNGLGFISTLGGYPENVDGQVKWVEDEESKFIPYNPKVMSFDDFHKLGLALAKKYRQDSVVIAKPVEGADENEPVMSAELWGHSGEDDWTYHVWDSWDNFRLPSLQNFMNRVKDKREVYYSKLKKGSHKGTKFEYSPYTTDNDPYNEGYQLAVFVPNSYSSRVGAAARGEALYLGVCVEPTLNFEEPVEDIATAVFANNSLREKFESKKNTKISESTASILNGKSVREVLLKS